MSTSAAASYHLSFNSNSTLQNKAFGPALPLQKKCDNLGKPSEIKV